MKEFQNIKESVKVNCSFCGREIECPKEMLQTSKKHMCYKCFQNADKLIKEEDLEKIHIDIPVDKMDELLPKSITNSLVKEAFPAFWKEQKEEVRAMSKKDLAEMMFGTGAYMAIHHLIHTLNQRDNTEDEKSGG